MKKTGNKTDQESAQRELKLYLEENIPLPKEQINELLEFNFFKQYQKDDYLLQMGEKTENSFFVLKGCVKSYHIIDGEERITDFYTEHDAITPHCIVTGSPSNYFLQCVEDSVFSVSTKEVEAAIYKKFPELIDLCRVTTEKELVTKQIEHETYINSSAEERYLTLLKEKPDLINRVPQYQLASYIGIKPESLSRIRRRLVGKK